jgi:serine/threonine protein kinase
MFSNETKDKINKLIRFAADYCRASPNITYKNKNLFNIGWRLQKYNYSVDFEYITFKGDMQKYNSIMTAVPSNKSLLNFEDDFIRDSFTKLIQYLTQNHKNFTKNLHFDILPSQKLMIKIHGVKENGSLRDLIFKSSPLDEFGKKYSNNRGKGLPRSIIALYGRNILDALAHLHKNNWYHLHLHSGNVLVEDDGGCVKISELENFVNDLPIRNEHFFNYVYECFNNEFYLKQITSSNTSQKNSAILSDIFKNSSNVFEKMDIISFGRILYEMTTGRELRAPYPDDLEYKEMDPEVVDILQIIFNKKIKKWLNKHKLRIHYNTSRNLYY